MKNNLIIGFARAVLILLISTNVFSGSDENDSLLQETLDIVLIEEYKPCADQSDFDSLEINTATSLMFLSGDAIFAEGDVIISSNNTRAIVSSYNIKTNELMYYQTAKTGFKSFLIGEKITTTSSDTGVSSIKEFVNDFIVPCSELIVSIEENPQQMVFIFADSAAAIKAKIAAQEMMAEIIAEEERAKRLAEFQAKLEAEKAAAARSNAIYQARLQQEQMIKERQAQLALERELAAFEAQLEADLAKQVADEALEQELAAFEAQLEAELAQEAVEREIAEFEAEYEAQQALLMEQMAVEKELAAFEAKLEAELAAEEMMAEIEAEMAKQAALEAFQQKLADEKAAAAASTAAYQAKVAAEKAAAAELAAFKAELAAHEECKAALALSDSNIALFKSALADGTLFSIGPQITAGTEFTANRWDDYASCIGALNYKNPF